MFNNLLTSVCDIYRRITTINEYGHKTQTFTTTPLYSEVPCRYDKIGNFTSTLAQTPSGQTARNEGVIFFNPDVDVITGDRIVLDGLSYTVSPSLKVHDGIGLHHKEVFVAIEET
jgi:hypothetical protein